MAKQIITITGALGSGKTVVGKAVAEKLSVPYVSTGDMQRALAEQKGMTTLELNQLAEKDPAIDHQIDAMTKKYAAENNRCLFDSRLAWHFVPNSFKCYLQVHDRIAAQRIFGDTRRKSEKYASIDEAYQALLERKASETKRFAELYGLELRDLDNYDLVVDTSVAKPEAITQTIVECFHNWLSNNEFSKFWASPGALFPTRSLDEARDEEPLNVADRNGFHLIVSGHKTVSEALHRAEQLLPYTPATADVQTNNALITDWEQKHNFKFFARPES